MTGVTDREGGGLRLPRPLSVSARGDLCVTWRVGFSKVARPPPPPALTPAGEGVRGLIGLAWYALMAGGSSGVIAGSFGTL